MIQAIKILIADDHKYFLDGLQTDILKHFPQATVLRAYNGKQIIEQVAVHKPQLLITDFEMPELDGLTAIKQARTYVPELKVIVITSYYDIQHIKALLKANIRVILDKQYVNENIVTAIEKALNNQEFYTKHIKATINDILHGKKTSKKNSALPRLTRREKELLPYFLKGLSNKEIADIVFLSPATIDTHRNNIYLKFGVNSAAKLIARAVELGFAE